MAKKLTTKQREYMRDVFGDAIREICQGFEVLSHEIAVAETLQKEGLIKITEYEHHLEARLAVGVFEYLDQLQ